MAQEEFKFPDEADDVVSEAEFEIEVEDDTPEEDRGRAPADPEKVKQLQIELEEADLDNYKDAKDKIIRMKRIWNDERRARGPEELANATGGRSTLDPIINHNHSPPRDLNPQLGSCDVEINRWQQSAGKCGGRHRNTSGSYRHHEAVLAHPLNEMGCQPLTCVGEITKGHGGPSVHPGRTLPLPKQ